MASVSGLPAQSIKLLSMRKGSIILDFELSGADAESAANKLKESFESGNLEDVFCGVATVGKTILWHAACEVELLQLTRVPIPSDAERDALTDIDRQILIAVLVGTMVVSLLASVLTIVFCRRRVRQRAAAKDAMQI